MLCYKHYATLEELYRLNEYLQDEGAVGICKN
jgi:hypothetical protein